jgi:hypothetical protein
MLKFHLNLFLVDTLGYGASTCSADGLDLTASYGTLASPNYPGNYGGSDFCIWRITASSSSAVSTKCI